MAGALGGRGSEGSDLAAIEGEGDIDLSLVGRARDRGGTAGGSVGHGEFESGVSAADVYTDTEKDPEVYYVWRGGDGVARRNRTYVWHRALSPRGELELRGPNQKLGRVSDRIRDRASNRPTPSL